MKPCQRIRTALIVFCLAAQAWGGPAQEPQASGAPSQEREACGLADQALAQKQPDLAVIEYNKCLSKNPPTFQMLSNLGMAYAQQEQFPQAIQAYVQALALDPDSAPIRMNLGLAYLKTNHPKEAAEQFARSMIADPHDAKTLELLAYAHFAMGEFALAAYEAGLVHNASPDDPSAALLLGSSYLRLEMYKSAMPLILGSLSQAKTAGAYMVLGEAFLGVKAWHQALEAFLNAAELDPSLRGIYCDEGEAYMAIGQLDKGAAAFKQELARDPNDFDANYFLGRLERINNHEADAMKYLEKANALRPGDPDVAYEFALMAWQKRDYQKAESLLQGVVQKVPTLKDAHVLLAQVYFRLHKTQEGTREKALVDALTTAETARYRAQIKAAQ
jgi:superkiller protein 3